MEVTNSDGGDLVRPGDTGGGGSELGSGGHPEPVRDICGVCGDYLLPESEWTGVGFYFCPNGAKHYENPPEAVRVAITLTFSADRPLTTDEVDALVNALAVQVEEPGTVDGSGEWVRAGFSTWDIRTEVKA